jgi:hypothetical protein
LSKAAKLIGRHTKIPEHFRHSSGTIRAGTNPGSRRGHRLWRRRIAVQFLRCIHIGRAFLLYPLSIRWPIPRLGESIANGIAHAGALRVTSRANLGTLGWSQRLEHGQLDIRAFGRPLTDDGCQFPALLSGNWHRESRAEKTRIDLASQIQDTAAVLAHTLVAPGPDLPQGLSLLW